MTVREIEKMIEKAGWYSVRQKGSHKHFKHDSIKGLVTVPQHRGDIHPDTVKSIFNQAKIK